MKIVILYHPNSESARNVESYAHDFEHRSSNKVTLVSLETREGAAQASLYDIVQYPAILVTDDTGHLQKEWQGAELPLMDEVAGYLVA